MTLDSLSELQIWYEEEIINSYKKIEVKEAGSVPRSIRKRMYSALDESFSAKKSSLANCEPSSALANTTAKANKSVTLFNDLSKSAYSSGKNMLSADEEQNSRSILLEVNEELLDNICIAAGVPIESICNIVYALPLTRKSHWPEKVEQAKKKINELRQNIG